MRFGMSRREVHHSIGPPQQQYKKFQAETLTDCFYDNQLQIYYDGHDLVEYIEINGPGDLGAIFEGVDLLSVAADEALEHVRRVAQVNPLGHEIPYAYDFPRIDLALWRPVVDDLEGRTFRSVGVGRPGYFSAGGH